MNLTPGTLFFALITVLTAQESFSQITLSNEVKQAMSRVEPEEIKAHISYLADDKLKGRAPGTEGFRMAMDYVTAQLKQLDVRPAGEKGTWLQTVRFRRAYPENVKVTIINPAAGYSPSATDYTVSANPVHPSINVAAPLAFAGFGISEPALGYDDYAGIDVKGKIVVIIRGAPENFSSSVSAHVVSSATLLRKAAAHGAVGIIIGSVDSVARTGGFGGGAGGGAVPVARPSTSILDEKGNAVVSGTYTSDKLKVHMTARYAFMKALFGKEGRYIQQVVAAMKTGKPQSFQTGTSLSVSYTSRYEDMISYNIIGKIQGSDRKLKREYVVHSAHLDHLGIGRAVQGDSIYNGAHDNASGVASLLGIAKVYHQMKAKPKRSILVVFVTGEEMGDLGSGYFAKRPTVPVKNMVADVNTDMPTIIAPLLSITALGAEHSSLVKQVEQAAAYLQLGVEADPEPKQARFTRSDQYSFVVAGIPALHIKYGSKTPDGKNNLNDLVAVWRAKYYHRAADDINGMFDFEAGKTYTQLNFLIGYLVAQDPDRPKWNEGDIFATN